MMKKAYAVVFLCLLSMTLLWILSRTLSYDRFANVVHQWKKQNEETIEDVYSRAHYDTDVPNTTRVNEIWMKDFWTEEDMLSLDQLTDAKNAVSMKQTLVHITNKSISVGDRIEISVSLVEINGRRRTRGGDKLHVRIWNTMNTAFAPGYVLDHDNGSYTAMIPALWPGQSLISVQLAYPRELIRAFYVTKRKNFTVRAIRGLFELNQLSEEVLCQPSGEYFAANKYVCNLTSENGGMSWFCERPKDARLTCENWTSVKPKNEYMILNGAERNLLSSTTLWEAKQLRTKIGDITVTVKGHLQRRDSLPNCSSVAKKLTWIDHNPPGFFFKGKWLPTFCNLPDDKLYGDCLNGKHFLVFGDSTTREWYSYMVNYLGCRQQTETWKQEAWHKRTLCYSSYMNFTAEWIPHGLPFYTGPFWFSKEHVTTPISSCLNKVSKNSKFVIVIHIFAHFSNFRSEVFRDRMHAISKSAETLLERNKNITILVKGPHTFSQIRSYFYYHYQRIIKEEFEHLYDKVVFMEQGGMTIAKQNKDIHPPHDILKEAMRQLIGYVC